MFQTECEDHVDQLVARSLGECEEDHLTLQQLVREFGRVNLGTAPEPVQDQILAAAQVYAGRYAGDTPADYDKLEAELDTLLLALDYAHNRQNWTAVLATGQF